MYRFPPKNPGEQHILIVSRLIKAIYKKVQLPEPCAEKSEAYKAGYQTICEIGKERIRRAGDKIKSESPMTTQDLDIGFRVLKLDDTNMKDVYYARMTTIRG